jgi:cell division protein ZapA
MNEDVFKIQLNLLGRYYPYTCKRTDEGKIRAAATNFTKKYMQYSSHYSGGELENSDIIAITGLHFSMETLEDKNQEDVSPMFQIIAKLNQQLEEYLQPVE